MVTFTEVERETLAGRPRVPIPDQLQQWLEQTYESRTMCALKVPTDDVGEFLRLCRLHAKHRGLTIQAEYVDREQLLRFRMKDKRPYRWRNREAT